MTRAVTVVATAVAVFACVGGVAARATAPVDGLHPGKLSFFAPSPVNDISHGGPRVVHRPSCLAHQIEAAAFTTPSPEGVLGVVELKGTTFYHRNQVGRLRCALPISKGPRAFLAANGQRLAVPRGRADRINPAANPYSNTVSADGKAAWGFGWFGSYCGVRPQWVLMTLPQHGGNIRVPYVGPTPRCPVDHSTAIASTLTDGPVGAPDSPVQPAPPSYLALTTSARFIGSTTDAQPEPVEVTISDTSGEPVTLVPCPLYALRTEDYVGEQRRTSTSSGGGSPGCTSKRRTLTVVPGKPVTFRISRRAFGQFPAPPKGSTFVVYVDLAGMPTAQTSTVVQ